MLVVSPSDTAIRQARAKTDRLDARTLARLLAAGSLDAVWMPDRWTWVMRRRLGRRAQLAWARSRAKNQIHAVLMRQLVGRPPFSDLFGAQGRKWLAELRLPLEESETVDGAMRQIEFLDSEIAGIERLIAQAAMESAQIKRLMSVPGVGVIVAASFLAAIGDISRFQDPRKLVGYLGLDPRVRQSGVSPATHGHISKRGSVRARHALVEACWTTVRPPGPLHSFYQRIRARRGHSVAIVATAQVVDMGAREKRRKPATRPLRRSLAWAVVRIGPHVRRVMPPAVARARLGTRASPRPERRGALPWRCRC